MAEPSTYQSLYRRYRSQRFDQVLGQDHITKALRNAVRDGRVGHAYLFSGPRGTGKTSTARILAKVLNCANPVDGEPCGECDACLVVERGQDVDWLLEQDAASKSKVDDMRDLLDRVPLGTSGRRKVIILDEVHMLSQGAENALLKTLEEPPDHVVFVLATTDPQKVRATIRSRTQHFEFHLLKPEVLADHVRHVIEDADLPLAEEAVPGIVDHVLQAGGGSARDTLSALDQVAALGEVVVETQPLDDILDAVAVHDPGRVLVAVAEAMSTGREPRTLGEALIVRLRDAFLAVMGAGDDHLPPAQREPAKRLGEQLGPARLTRALEVLGEALMELARKPDPRVVVEVALVRLARPDTDRSLDALAARLDELERAVRTGVPAQPAAASGQTPTALGEAGVPGEPQTSGGDRGASDTGASEAGASEAGATTQTASTGGPAHAARAALAAERTTKAAAPPPAGKQALGALVRDRGGAGDTENGADQPNPTPAPASTPAPAQDDVEAEADPEPPSASIDPPVGDPPPAAAPPPASDPTTAADALPALDKLETAWQASVLEGLPIPIRSKWRGGVWRQVAEGRARFAVPNEWHKKACDEGRPAVEQALAEHFGTRVPVEVVVEGGGPGDESSPGGGSARGAAQTGGGGQGRSDATVSSSGAAGAASAVGTASASASAPATNGNHHGDPLDEHVDMTDFSELADADVATSGVDLLRREFGGELIKLDDAEAS